MINLIKSMLQGRYETYLGWRGLFKLFFVYLILMFLNECNRFKTVLNLEKSLGLKSVESFLELIYCFDATALFHVSKKLTALFRKLKQMTGNFEC